MVFAFAVVSEDSPAAGWADRDLRVDDMDAFFVGSVDPCCNLAHQVADPCLHCLPAGFYVLNRVG